ncbi:phospho-sugar mutase [Skermania sp. ID1734]|uniref:phospho-sugar mutase n=1 Tax=Skermania sp. ID1734 TaxID=2597516 RepID=UPI00117BEABA|nr:phospho-sugar mutase [Skermania sp. ID1734]TSE02034.1 phospho-sugar mutase [Skermania sp. ID1734]
MTTPQEWIAGDPDPRDRAELLALPDDDLATRFEHPLAFGTAGLRGQMCAGPSGMNLAVVIRTTAAVVEWLRGRCLGGGRVVVGHDARHKSAEFASAAAEVFAAAGFPVTFLPAALPTPITSFAVKRLDAVAGVQITASHNPATDNGYKLYVTGGAQLVSPADREIEQLTRLVGPANAVPRSSVTRSGQDLVGQYLSRVTELPRGSVRRLRIAVTAMHGVGGEVLVSALRRAGFTDVHVVEEQFAPNPDFPTVAYPNPEELGATDRLLGMAAEVNADIAIALDPDADRCAFGISGPSGWRMLTGDETGALLADYILGAAPADPLVATTIVSSRLLAAIAESHGARYAETLTGFKWLVRAGPGLVYAYEEAIGHCVDPAFVRDKDGISASVLMADLAATTLAGGKHVHDLLDDLAVRFGVYATGQFSRHLSRADEISTVMARLRADPPKVLAGASVSCDDYLERRGPMHTDALVFNGGNIRMVVRPSGTEPKVKCYLEVIEPVADRADLARARTAAEARLSELREFAGALA